MLVGNKIDKPHRAVSTEEGREFASSHDLPFFEASAVEGVNVKEPYEALAGQLAAQP